MLTWILRRVTPVALPQPTARLTLVKPVLAVRPAPVEVPKPQRIGFRG